MDRADRVPVELHTSVFGSGPRVVFVHGSMTTSEQTWAKQRSLADRWLLVIADRRGYEPNPIAGFSDFEIDGADLAPLLGDGAHLVGHSYGALGALFAAAARPEVVHSLTLIETPALSLVRGLPVGGQIAAHLARMQTIDEPRAFHVAFLQQLGAPTESLPQVLPASLERQVRLLMNERPPWEAALPIDTLANAEFPKLVVSGGWDEGLEAASDALAQQLGSRAERAVIAGKGHVVQRVGQPFNEALQAFLRSAESG